MTFFRCLDDVLVGKTRAIEISSSEKKKSYISTHSVQPCRPGVTRLLVLILLVRVAADGDDADSRTWGVGDDDGLPRWVVL